VGHPKAFSEKLQDFSGTTDLATAVLWKTATILLLSVSALALPAREKDATQYGTGLIVNIPFQESEVSQVVQDVIQNGIIRGTKEYNKDEFITGATPATSTRVFAEWTEGGKVFYKIRLKALDPRNFKDSSDVGTLAVRYVVQPQGDKNTVLRIDARFVEDFRHVSHPSNGSVEGAEYKDIHDHLDAIEVMKAQTVEALREKHEQLARTQTPALADPVPAAVPESVSTRSVNTEAASTTTAPSAQTLEQRVQELRRQVQRLVKAPGAALRSAPFHTATALQSLPTGTEVMIVVSTTYWLGVETHEGQHGWILRDELELLP
jgi:polyhydroxyalkanoate synthesis regulator phasin